MRMLFAAVAATAVLAGTGLAAAQTTQDPNRAPVAQPSGQPNAASRDQSGTPGTGGNVGTGGAATPATGTTGTSPGGATAGQGGMANPATQPNSQNRDQSGTPGTGTSAPAAGGSPRQ